MADELTSGEFREAAATPSGFTGVCNWCKRTGHMARDCPRKKRGLPALNPAKKLQPSTAAARAAAEAAAY